MIELHVPAGLASAAALTQIKLSATRFPGAEELTLVITQQPGVRVVIDPFNGEPRTVPVASVPRRLTLGPEWRYDASPACLSALAEFGEVVHPSV